MPISRRDFLQVIGILAAGTAAGCSPLSRYLPHTPYKASSGIQPGEWLALNRLTFGPTLEERQQLAGSSLKNWVENQLQPGGIRDLKVKVLLSGIDILDMRADELRARADGLFNSYDENQVLDPFRQATLLRMVYSRRQLYEVMVEFWSDHFNISIHKGDCWYLKPVDDREVIRQHALGNFRQLLGASMHSPAMLIYLDNQSNHRDAPNENYARELLELHTLGVDGGYTQKDVMELARCLTGWTVKDHFWRGQIRFDPQAHDQGRKEVLGLRIAPAGEQEMEHVLDRLAVHPSTAQTLSRKLARRFVADQPPQEIVDRAARAYLGSGGEIKAALRVILLDGLSGNGHPAPKYKRPVNFLVSALRQTGADTDGGKALQAHLKRMGQPLFAWPSPDGYPDRTDAWQGNLLPRWKFALDLVRNQIPGTVLETDSLLQLGQEKSFPSFLEAAARRLFGGPLPTQTRDALLSTLQPSLGDHNSEPAAVSLAALLASPAFQWR